MGNGLPACYGELLSVSPLDVLQARPNVAAAVQARAAGDGSVSRRGPWEPGGGLVWRATCGGAKFGRRAVCPTPTSHPSSYYTSLDESCGSIVAHHWQRDLVPKSCELAFMHSTGGGGT
jgi:hypothetical protein